MVVNDFLVEQFPQILDYQFTASVEQEFDEIAEGRVQWQEMMKKFYDPFHRNVQVTLDTAQRQTGERELGIDPATGKPVIVRIARFGPVVQIGGSEDEEKKYANLRAGQSIATIGLEEALKLFDLPRQLGEYKDQKVSAAIGRFGPFIKWGNLFASLKVKEGDDPYTIQLDRAIQLIEDKVAAVAASELRIFDENPEVRILKGRFGPYIKSGKDNFKLPKTSDPTLITYAEVAQMIADQEAAGGGKKAASKRPTAAKKAPAKKAASKKAPAKKAAAKKSATKKK
jgi:DNA topoisomerase-1